MRSVLVSILIVLQYAAQLECRSLTRSGFPPARTAPSSREDLDSIIARNREITDLLIPLLEANLETKRQESKRGDLLKVFRDSKARKDLELLPLNKRQARERKPVALILASELRSRSKKGRNKVHAQKAFIIQNDDKASSSDEDDLVNGDDENEIVEEMVKDLDLEQQNLKHELNATKSNGDDYADDDDIENEKNDNFSVVNDTSDDSDYLSDEDATKEVYGEIKFSPRFVESYSDEFDDTKSSESGNEDSKQSTSQVNTDTDEEIQIIKADSYSESLETAAKNAVESDGHVDLKHTKVQTRGSKSSETEENDDSTYRRDKEHRSIKKNNEQYFETLINSQEKEHSTSTSNEESHEDSVTNENNLSQPDIYSDIDVSDDYDNVDKVSDVDQTYKDVEDSNSGSNEEFKREGDVASESQSNNDVSDSDTGPYETAGNNGDTYADTDDTTTIDDDANSDLVEDSDNSSTDNQNTDTEENKKELTYSEEIAQKYEADSKYTVENDDSLIATSGELSKFNVESVEGLIEVLKQEDMDNKSKCDDDLSDDVNTLSDFDHSHEVHKSYKLSFKFSK